VAQCKECGANLPDEARFCLQCGSPVRPDYPESETPAQPPGPATELDFFQPALVGGLFLGLLSNLPFIMAGNCLCCMWILGGGGLAAYLVAQQRPGGIAYGDGAFAGVMSGLFGAVVGTAVSIPIRLLTARFLENQREAIENVFRNIPELEGSMRELLIRALSPEVSATTVLFLFISNLILYALFAMIGGIITVALLNKQR
jgi:hypothetical protein